MSLLCVLLLLFAITRCFAGDVVLIHVKQAPVNNEEEIRRVAEFYGLTLYTADVGSRDTINRAVSLLRKSGTLALVVSQDALPVLDLRQIHAALGRPKRRSIPILVYGIVEGQHSDGLNQWSDGAIRECEPIAKDFRPRVLQVGSDKAISRSLTGIELPAVASPMCRMRLEPGAAAETVLAVRAGSGTDSAVLVHHEAKGGEIFFLPRMETFDQSWAGNSGSLPRAFSSMAPFVLFLSYAAGDYGWHSDGRYANLTIDDAWLTQPYGHLDYAALLSEMEKHNFHTTIAFVPWNFDRSEPAVASLFRTHPERLSICLHGNNHDHQEFGGYAVNSLRDQIADIKQGIARMEKFQSLTGIPYDRFMVFPHGVAPNETFEALQKYNFLGTANSRNVPMDAAFPAAPEFLWRPLTVNYGNVLSLSRYQAAAGIPRLEIAIQSFLGNPILFYGHEDFFNKGIDAFDEFANQVNRLQPDTRWTTLGDISRHSQLIRRHENGGFDVLMFSNEMQLSNSSAKDELFYITRKEDSSSTPLLTIDGAPAEFERSNGAIGIRLLIPGHQSRRLRVLYPNDLDQSRDYVRKSSIRVYMLRRVSDFRDLYLSRSAVGSAITRVYYREGWNEIEARLERRGWVAMICLGVALAGLQGLRRRSPRRVGVGTSGEQTRLRGSSATKDGPPRHGRTFEQPPRRVVENKSTTPDRAQSHR